MKRLHHVMHVQLDGVKTTTPTRKNLNIVLRAYQENFKMKLHRPHANNVQPTLNQQYQDVPQLAMCAEMVVRHHQVVPNVVTVWQENFKKLKVSNFRFAHRAVQVVLQTLPIWIAASFVKREDTNPVKDKQAVCLAIQARTKTMKENYFANHVP
jgi:hypothetical protein